MDIENLLHKNQQDLFNFSPYRFIRTIDPDYLVESTVIQPMLSSLAEGALEDIVIQVEGMNHHFLVQKLDWDSNYFGFTNYKIHNVIFGHHTYTLLLKAVHSFMKEFCTETDAYYYLDLPHEAILLYQAFTANGFRMVESRMNLYYDGLTGYSVKERYPVRHASGADDAAKLQRVAMEMRNPFDRFHADVMIADEIADKYIGQFAYNSVMGFADFVLVPDIPDTPPFGFLTANKPEKVGDYNVSALGLAAIDNRNNEKGWLYKLQSEMIYLLKDNKVDILTTITQTSNVAAFKTWEKFGFKLGFFTGILAYKNS